MSEWPDYVTYAFGQLGYENYEDGIEPFVSRWSGLDMETFVRVLKEGQDEDTVLAIFALGRLNRPWARELLLPCLQSAQPMERWASALCLGKMREEEALPVLLRTLTEFFPPKEWPSFQGDDLWLYNNWRLQTILTIAEWARPEAIPALLDALQAFWHVEHLIPERHTVSRRYWRWCQGRTVYALGWLGEFDALNALEGADATLQSWEVYLALGYLHAHVDYPDVFTRSWKFLPGLREKVIGVLKDQLGLSEEEQVRCLDSYREIKW